MSWLVRLTVASMMSAVIVVKIYDVIVGGILGPLASAAKKSLFVGAWTSITTALGMHDLKKTARNLRRGKKGVGARIKPLLKNKRFK